MNNSNLEKQIESVLFWKAEPMKIGDLAKALAAKDSEILESAQNLQKNLEGRGINLIINDKELHLVTDPSAGPLIEKLIKEEINKELSKAALETLSIILYKGPIKRAEIDYIRGVNSQFIIRNLMIRGLVDKEQNPDDERGFYYKASQNLLNFMGLKSSAEMPDYQKVRDDIDDFMNNQKTEEKENVEKIQ